MKIGLTISDYYKDYLKEVATLNGTTPTTIVGYIVENFLNYNKKYNRLPLFKKTTTLVFAKKSTTEVDTEVVEEQPKKHLSKEELLKEIYEDTDYQDTWTPDSSD